ncbi:hypothetical protein [Microbacterium sp. LWH3-1.2]|uniref:hypothetical protein n=1 Tax=Microbacterium sp. LWH3-1.2 TaxID=3135256 RepID=UPI00343EEA58
MKRATPDLVMMSFTPPTAASNPYVHLLVASLNDAGVKVEFFSWRRLLRGSVRLLHVHWPETMLQRRTRIGRVVSRVLFLLLLVRVKLRWTAVVRTVHNRAPHEGAAGMDAWLLRQLDVVTTLWINLNPDVFAPNGRPAVVIPHGELGSWYEKHELGTGTVPPVDLLYFGLVRPYKGVDRLASIVAEQEAFSLRIAGRPLDEDLRLVLESVSAASKNIQLDLRHIPDDELIAYIRASRLIVLPYTKFENSGSANLALDLGTPVLVRESPSSRELQQLFGTGLVHLFSGDLSAGDLAAALQIRSDALPGSRPIVPHREWNNQAALHKAAYGDALVAMTSGSG